MEENWKFLIGEKVKWTAGKEDRPILLRGLYLEQIDDKLSKVMCLEHRGMKAHAEMEVRTDLLERDSS